MPMSTSPFAYGDCVEAMERALESPHGVSSPCDTEKAAKHLVHRMNYARKLDRDRNLKIYPEEHPMHGRSAFDRLVIRAVGRRVVITRLKELMLEDIRPEDGL